jgi:uncharacterized protein YndB with AHSA1/START domain
MKLATLLALAAVCSGNCTPILAAPTEERRVLKEVVVKAPVAAVWKAWTTSEGIVSFFAPEAVVEARPDGPFHIHMNPYGAPGLKGADDMRVMGVQENRMLSFSWNAPPHLAEARRQRTFVIVRLEPMGETETRVRLTHTGWGDGGQWDQTHAYFDRAWGNVLANLQKRFAEGPVDWTPWLERLKAMQEEEARKKAQ